MTASLATARPENARRSERIADVIRARVLYGEYPPGRRTSEREITEEFGVSRSPAREALNLLHAEGVLTLLSNRGAMVPDYDQRLIENTIEVVEYMEAAAGELACRRIGDEKIKFISGLTMRMRDAFAGGRRLLYYRLNNQIHEEIVGASGNIVLINDYVKYNARLYRIRFLPGGSRINLASAMREHLAMVKFLKRRDGKALGALLSRHLSHAWKRAGVHPVPPRDNNKGENQ